MWGDRRRQRDRLVVCGGERRLNRKGSCISEHHLHCLHCGYNLPNVYRGRSPLCDQRGLLSSCWWICQESRRARGTCLVRDEKAVGIDCVRAAPAPAIFAPLRALCAADVLLLYRNDNFPPALFPLLLSRYVVCNPRRDLCVFHRSSTNSIITSSPGPKTNYNYLHRQRIHRWIYRHT